MQRLEVSGAVRPIYGSLSVKRLRQGQHICHIPQSFRPPVGPDDPPIQWVSEAFSSGVKAAADMMLTTLPDLVPNLRISGTIPTFSPTCAFMVFSGTTKLRI